jgi:hypothetical protein
MSCDKSNKRPRLSMASCGSINDDGPDESLSRRHQQPSSLLDGDALLESSAAMISVPVELIFRQVLNEGQPKPLLSRSEAQTFLTINVLCEQLDSLTNLNEALLQEEQETSLSDNVIQNDHPQLRSLQVVLSSYHERRPAWSELPNRLSWYGAVVSCVTVPSKTGPFRNCWDLPLEWKNESCQMSKTKFAGVFNSSYTVRGLLLDIDKTIPANQKNATPCRP